MDVVHCPTCGHAVPQGNLAMHQAMCVPTHCPPASSIRLSPRTTTTPSSSSSWCAPAARGGGLVTLTSPPPRVYAGRATMAAAAAGTTNSPGGILQVGDVVDLMQDDDDDNNNASSSDTTDEPTWRCSRCTLDNRRQALHCEACQHPNPRVAAMPSSSSSSFLSPRWPVAHPVRNTHHHYATNRDEGGSFVRPPDAVRRDRLVEEPWYAEPHAISAAPPSSPLRYVVSGGALVGGVLGASGAYLRGHPVASSAMEGAVSGAVSGAVLHEFGRPRRTSAVTLGGRRPAPHGPPADTAVWQPLARMPVQRWQQMQQRPAYGGDRRRQSIDSMSYEQMLSAFGDGSDNLGASAGTISQLPTSVVEHVHSLPPDCQCCHICLESYERGDIRKTLPCLHGFHEACADKWLSTNGSCPVCKHRICTE